MQDGAGPAMNYDTRIAAEDLAETDSAAVLMGDAEEDRRSRRRLWTIGLAVFAGLVGIWFMTHRDDQAAAGDKKSQAAVVSVVAGLLLGWMVSQDQMIGWGVNGFGVGAILPLVVLTAAALVVPAFTGKNVYCNRICPHGAAQTLAGEFLRKRLHLPPKLLASW